MSVRSRVIGTVSANSLRKSCKRLWRRLRGRLHNTVHTMRNSRFTIAKGSTDMSRDQDLMRTNGFVIRRGMFDAATAERLATELENEIPAELVGRSISDACTKLPFARRQLTNPLIRQSMESLLPAPQFLQVCDVQMNHNRDNWHRDSACRTFGLGDWQEQSEVYRVCKIIIYLRCDKAGLAVIPGSHRAKVKVPPGDDNFIVLPPTDAVDRALTDGKTSAKYVVGMKTGDALIFDERLLHCGRRHDDHGHVVDTFLGPKTTLAYVFGDASRHSWRFYAYFRFLRPELKFKDLPDDFVGTLRETGLLPSFYGRDLFTEHPEELANITGK